MRDSVTIHKALLGVEVYEISAKTIFKIRSKQNNPDNVFDSLPEYTINLNKNANNSPISARYYLQYVGLIDSPELENDKYLFFDFCTLDDCLDYEISAIGADELLNGFDFKKILSNFTPQNDKDIIYRKNAHTEYLIVEITYSYTIDGHSGAYEGDTEIDIVGYLDQDLNKVLFKNNEN